MKKSFNQVDPINNNSQSVNPVGKTSTVINPLFRMVEERYGLVIEPEIWICKDIIQVIKFYDEDSPIAWTTNDIINHIPKSSYIHNLVCKFNLSGCNIMQGSSIYEITQTGPYSDQHWFNQGKDSKDVDFCCLQPVLFAKMEGREYAFRLNNLTFVCALFDCELTPNCSPKRLIQSRDEFKKILVDNISYHKNLLQSVSEKDLDGRGIVDIILSQMRNPNL